MTDQIAILGTGPSSLYLGLLLSHRGWNVKVFDPRTPWERPRGAGLSTDALSELPHFEGFTEWKEIDAIRVVSPRNKEEVIHCSQPLRVGGREEITDFLQERVLEKGIEISASKFDGFEKREGRWVVRTKDGEENFDLLVGGDGASSIARKGFGLPVTAEEMTIEVSYEAPHILDSGRTGLIRFLKELPGFFWAMPHRRGTVVRLWATSRRLHARTLLEKLDHMAQHLLEVPPSAAKARTVAHLPVFRKIDPKTLFGKDWALIGDAAGLVNPLSQDGLYFGLKSAAVLALSLRGSELDAPNYLAHLRDEILKPLSKKWKRHRLWSRHVLGMYWFDHFVVSLPRHHAAQEEILGLFRGEKSA